MKLAIIGDLHLFTLRIHPRRLLSRRVMAQSNLWLNRRHRFNHALLPELADRVRHVAPEMLLLSGDVTTSSLESEFEDFMAFARPLVGQGTDEAGIPGVLVPGNHDRYTFKSRRVKRIEDLLESVMPARFPDLRDLSPGWQLLALDSAIPNKVFSRGALGSDQLAEAEQAIRSVPAGQGLVVLCHYPCTLPPRVPSAWSHDLKEDARLRAALQACPGRVVYVHGHIHKPWHVLPEVVDDADAPVPVTRARSGLTGRGRRGGKLKPAFECINAGSPCMTSEKYPLGQGFWEIELPEDPLAPLRSVHHVPLPADMETDADGDANTDQGHAGGTDRATAPAPPTSRATAGGVRWITGPTV